MRTTSPLSQLKASSHVAPTRPLHNSFSRRRRGDESQISQVFESKVRDASPRLLLVQQAATELGWLRDLAAINMTLLRSLTRLSSKLRRSVISVVMGLHNHKLRRSGINQLRA